MVDVLSVIVQEREARHWSEYQLAEKSGLPQSTISSWYSKNVVPKVSSLEKICDAFGITMSQLFAGNDEAVVLTKSQKDLIEHWSHLTPEQQEALFHLLSTM